MVEPLDPLQGGRVEHLFLLCFIQRLSVLQSVVELVFTSVCLLNQHVRRAHVSQTTSPGLTLLAPTGVILLFILVSQSVVVVDHIVLVYSVS